MEIKKFTQKVNDNIYFKKAKRTLLTAECVVPAAIFGFACLGTAVEYIDDPQVQLEQPTHSQKSDPRYIRCYKKEQNDYDNEATNSNSKYLDMFDSYYTGFGIPDYSLINSIAADYCVKLIFKENN